ncbi:MAG TPA: hypothetical protein VNJ06_06770 [Gemmatimonadales bacterium]|nr:hypothetical protein [Gemmatimonadales bacterium]
MKIIARETNAVGFALQIARSSQDTVYGFPIHRCLGLSLQQQAEPHRVETAIGM